MSSDPMGEAAAAHVVAARHPDDTRRILVTAAALVIAFASSYIPAPGINLDVIGGAAGALAIDTGMLSRLSITALWFTPVMSALLLTEALKLVVPPQSALPEKNQRLLKTRFNRFTVVVGLLLATLQAYGVAVGLEGIQGTGGVPMVLDPGIGFRIPFMLTQVAGVALLIALADQITRYGIGSGFWVMIVAGEVSGLGTSLAGLLATFQSGMIHGGVLLALAAMSATTVATTVALFGASVRHADGPAHTALASEALLIPPLLGAALAQLVYGFRPLVSFLAGNEVSPEFAYALDDPILLFLTGLMILLVAYLGALRPYSVLAADGTSTVRPALVAGAATAVLTIALAVVSAQAGIQPLSVPILIAITLIVLTASPGLAVRAASAAL